MRTGLHALAGLGGPPPFADDLAAMQLGDCPSSLPGIALHARAVDAHAIGAAGVASDDAGQCWFLGEIEDANAVAATLGCAPEPAAIALAAMRHWGPATTDHLAGEWSLLFWSAAERTLWLGTSRQMRDRLYYAFDGDRFAVSSDFVRLSRVSWIGAAFDTLGMAGALGPWEVRQRRPGLTLFRNIFELEPGCFHGFAANGEHRIVRHAPDAPLPWDGSFDAAMTAIEDRLMRVIGAAIAPHDRVGVVLSGGLDSAVVARILAHARRPGQTVIALTSVAAPGSGRRDERDLAAAVTQALGIEHHLVWPDESARLFRWATDDGLPGQLALSSNHHVLNAIAVRARTLGITALFDGCNGEVSVSGSEGLHEPPVGLRALKAWLVGQLPWRRDRDAGIVERFIVPPSRALRDRLPADFSGVERQPIPRLWRRKLPPRIGLPPAYAKAWRISSTQMPWDMRWSSPLRDRQLMRMVAGMPRAFATWHGQDRCFARELLRGHVPDFVADQPKGLGISVDYVDRFQRELPELVARIPAWRDARVDEWIDLDWIAREARALTGRPDTPFGAQLRVQAAALAAERIAWLRQFTG